jgi:hypothetical protein
VTPRATIAELPDGVRIEVPARRDPYLVLYGAFVLGMWALGEGAILHTLLAEPASRGERLAAAFCLVPWTAVGLVAIAACLWLAVGRAVVTATERALTIRCAALGLGTTREYDMAHVHALRLAPAWVFRPASALERTIWLVPGAGAIAMDYGARTVRFGNGLDEGEARRIAERIAARFHIPTPSLSTGPATES